VVDHRKTFLLTANTTCDKLMLLANRSGMGQNKNEQNRNELLPGTLSLMVLRTLESLGPLHGYALLNLQQMGWISAKWGVSENNRRARYYTITKRGRKQLAAETESWQRMADIMVRFVESE
jgi:PadR family transcriptional regulator PadR